MGTRSRRVRKQRGGATNADIDRKLLNVNTLSREEINAVIDTTTGEALGGGYWTLLGYAIDKNNYKAALQLLARGADPKNKRSDSTPLKTVKRYVDGIDLSDADLINQGKFIKIAEIMEIADESERVSMAGTYLKEITDKEKKDAELAAVVAASGLQRSMGGRGLVAPRPLPAASAAAPSALPSPAASAAAPSALPSPAASSLPPTTIRTRPPPSPAPPRAPPAPPARKMIGGARKTRRRKQRKSRRRN
jgi:hypothetical protein